MPATPLVYAPLLHPWCCALRPLSSPAAVMGSTHVCAEFLLQAGHAVLQLLHALAQLVALALRHLQGQGRPWWGGALCHLQGQGRPADGGLAALQTQASMLVAGRPADRPAGGFLAPGVGLPGTKHAAARAGNVPDAMLSLLSVPGTALSCNQAPPAAATRHRPQLQPPHLHGLLGCSRLGGGGCSLRLCSA